MSYQLKVVKDYPIGFWPLDESSGTTAADISGCNNNGTYSGGITTGLIPLVSGGTNGSLITNTKYITLPVTKDYYGSTADGGFADENSSDNDFSLEVWIYPKITTSALTPIFADTTALTEAGYVGVYYEKGNIVFKLEGERIDYTLPIINQSTHIVAVYSKSSMSLYVNGKFVSSKSLDNFKFTNSSITLKIGPTTSASDSFVVDAPAVYRYGLDSNIAAEHYNISSGTSPLQVAYPENGTLFDIYDDGVARQYAFMYPANRPWEYFLTEDLIYNGEEKYIEIKKTATAASKSVVITDAISIPSGFSLDSSKIEWNGDNGVSIRTSIDGTSWQACTNGRSIPQFKLDDNSFSSERILYLEITLSSSDASKYLPRLYSLIICFYNDQILYSQTNGDYINTLDGLSGATIKEITTGRISYPILSRHKNNGLRTGSASGFKVNTSESVRTAEFFLTLSALTANCILFSSADGDYVASKFAWGNTGTIDKTNISAIYVNGVDKTSATNISTVFTADELYHVVIVVSGPITGPIRFNYLSSGGPSSLYQYLSYYPEAFTSQNAISHYAMHTGRSSAVADDSSVSLTENAVNFYNNDWIVIQNR